jgi:two-component sensor histidine kinase
MFLSKANSAAPAEQNTSDVSSGFSLLEQSLQRQAELEAIVELQQRQLGETRELLNEVNHRAKNSLQMAMAMLSMQALASEDPRTAEALDAASQRLGYLARVHELLYQRGDDVQAIDIADFLEDIISTLANAFQRPDVSVSVDVEPLMLGVSQAMNVALIAGEALLNAYKYAFPAGRCGTVIVSLTCSSDTCRLQISDNGVGFAAELRRGSLGMRLLRALGRALGGETVVVGERGTSVSVTFPKEAG